MEGTRLLFVEDDEAISLGLEYSLRQEGLLSPAVPVLPEPLLPFEEEAFDLALLDLSLPDGSGYDICRFIKKERDMPVVFLTARDDEGNVVMGLDMGADDYIVKPFRLRELISRLHSVLRRCRKDPAENGVYRYGNVCIHTHQGKVYKQGKDVFHRSGISSAADPDPERRPCFPAISCWKISGIFPATSSMTIP